MKKVFYILLIVVWLGVIFFFSNESGPETHRTSKNMINEVVITIEFITNVDLDNSKIMNNFDYIVRKCAHFTEYFILGIFIFILINYKDMNYKILLSIFICFICASFDEIHQIFIFNRTPCFKDILIDTLGAITSILLFNKIKKKNKNKQITIN